MKKEKLFNYLDGYYFVEESEITLAINDFFRDYIEKDENYLLRIDIFSRACWRVYKRKKYRIFTFLTKNQPWKTYNWKRFEKRII